jgi:CheY-like chemotaxis protein
MENILIKQPTIVWADDDPDELALMHEVLQELNSNYQVVEACNGCQVFQYLEQAKQSGVFPCLIVLDLNMPVLSGKETLLRLKQEPTFQQIPTVVFTTSSNPLDKRYCEKYGTQMLTKPLNYVELKQSIDKLLKLCDVSDKVH